MPRATRRSNRQGHGAHEESREASIRPFWSGTLSFGLVSIPVDVYPANRDSRISLRLLGADGEPLKRAYYSPENGRDLDSEQTTRGFETSKGKYVLLSDEELERLAPEKSRDIDLRLFVAANEISPLYFDKAYFLTPGDQSAKAYRLFAATLERSDRVGVATFVMRGKEHLVAIIAKDGILRAETLRFSDEIRKPAGIGLAKKRKAAPKTVRSFETAIARVSKKTLDLKEMSDQHAKTLLKLIGQKSRKQKNVVESETREQRPAKVIDLMEVLKQSLAQKEK